MSLHGDLREQARHLAAREPTRPKEEERHRADDNLALLFTRTEVLARLQDLDSAVAGWRRVRLEPASRFFLMALPLWDPLRR